MNNSQVRVGDWKKHYDQVKKTEEINLEHKVFAHNFNEVEPIIINSEESSSSDTASDGSS